MMKSGSHAKIRTIALTTLRVFIGVVVWFVLMFLYLRAYDLIESNALPVLLSTKTFVTSDWDNGYFSAKGSFVNQSAVNPGDELLPQANAISCEKTTNTCTLSTGDVWDHYLNVDLSSFEVTSWTSQQITFADGSPICVTNSYVIDRAAQTMTLLVRKRAVIPDYAAKADYHPCDNIKDANIDLADGFKVSQQRRRDFEAQYGFYFHLALAGINIIFFAVVSSLWRRRKQAFSANN